MQTIIKAAEEAIKSKKKFVNELCQALTDLGHQIANENQQISDMEADLKDYQQYKQCKNAGIGLVGKEFTDMRTIRP